jgi:hypothetical protein
MLKGADALHTLIRQRHLTPSCGGHVARCGWLFGQRPLMLLLSPFSKSAAAWDERIEK